MRPEQWDRVQELLDRALDLPEERRRSFLGELSDEDATVLREVRSLLGFHTEGFLNREQLASLLPPEPAAAHPDEIGPYRVTALLGEGGMGVVYRAEQQQPVRRTVALKLIKLGMDTRQVVARFDSERQALALMSHPNIARVYDAGAAPDGRPYFAMEYVEGRPITEYCDHERMTTFERLELFVQVCSGVQHAHQKGIIHRDLKPSNVLVTAQDDGSVPKIIDFGIAKATEKRAAEATMLTEVGQVVGTLAYMSPEQARLTGRDVDTRTDVYSLGVLLYELLVGTVPFDTTRPDVAFDEICRRIREVDPPRPSTRFHGLGETSGDVSLRRRTDPGSFERTLRGDLDWIVMKALEKDQARRYASASELAADVRHFLAHEPVVARPPATLYRVGKFVRRHRAGVAFAVLLLAALVTGVVATSVAMVRAQRAEREAVAAADYLVSLFRALKPGRAGGATDALEILDSKADEIRDVLDEQPGLRGRFMTAMAEAYTDRGSHERALALLDDALPLLREAGDDREVFNTLNELGRLANLLKNHSRAKEYLEQAVAIAEATMGPDHKNVATVLKNLADTNIRLGNLDVARGQLERALEIRRVEFGEDHRRVAPVMNSLADLLARQGEYDEAIRLAKRSLQIRQAAFEEQDQRVAYGFYSLADIQYEATAYEDARTNLEAALRIYQETLGPDHAFVGDCLFDLAETLLALNRPDEAYALYRRARDVHERAYDAKSPEQAGALAATLERHVELLGQLDRPDEAEATSRAAADLRRRHSLEP